MTAIQSLYDCGAILAERFDSIKDWERRLGTVSGNPGYCKSPIGGRGMTGGSGAVLNFSKKNKTNYTAKSVVMWLTTGAQTGSDRIILYNGYNTSPYGDMIIRGGNSNYIYIYLKNTSSEAQSAGIQITPNSPLVIGYSWDGATVTYYKNGISAAVPDALAGTLSCSTGYIVGTVGNPLSSDDKLHAIAVFDRALTATEMLDLAKGQPFDRINLARVSEWRPGAGPTIPDTGWKNLGNNGTATDVTAVETPYGVGGRFNGSTSRIDCVGTNLNITSEITLEVLMKINAASADRAMLLGYSGDSRARLWLYTDRKLYAEYKDSASNYMDTYAAGTVAAIGRWYHYISTYSYVNNKINDYVNGVKTATVPANNTTLFSSTVNFDIGANAETANRWFNGNIAYAAIYNEALTPLQVRKRFNDVMARRF